jgi:hypothetical protein
MSSSTTSSTLSTSRGEATPLTASPTTSTPASATSSA